MTFVFALPFSPVFEWRFFPGWGGGNRRPLLSNTNKRTNLNRDPALERDLRAAYILFFEAYAQRELGSLRAEGACVR